VHATKTVINTPKAFNKQKNNKRIISGIKVWRVEIMVKGNRHDEKNLKWNLNYYKYRRKNNYYRNVKN
jgi:hypothetical protein